MRRIWLAVLIVGLLPGIAWTQERPCSPRRHAKLPAITESTYHKARKRLLAAGWQPVQTKSFNEASSDPDISHGNGRLFWRKGYVEVEACTGTGVAACAFLLKIITGIVFASPPQARKSRAGNITRELLASNLCVTKRRAVMKPQASLLSR